MATIGNINVAITASTKGLNAGIKQAKKSVGGLGQKLGKIGKTRVPGSGLIGAVGSVLTGRALVKASDEWTVINNKVRTVTDSVGEQKKRVGELLEGAQRSRASVGAITAVFQRFALAGRQFNTTNDEAQKMVETLFKIGVVGGVTGVEMAATLIQLSQGFGKGRLDGIELTSVMEQMAPLAVLFAARLGVPIGKLKELGAAGKITSAIIKSTLTDAADTVDAKFALTKATVEQQLTLLNNKWIEVVGSINEATGATNEIGLALTAVGKIMDGITSAAKRGGFLTIFNNLSDLGSGGQGTETSGLDSGRQQNRFFGENNPLKLTNGRLEEKNSDKILAEMKKNTEAIVNNMSNFRQSGTFQ